MLRTLVGLTLLFTVAFIPVVTAAVTSGTPDAGAYAVRVQNNATGKQMEWQAKKFPDQASCLKALGNLPEQLAVLQRAKVDPSVTMPDTQGTDPELENDVGTLIIMIIQNTGTLPDLSVLCHPVEQSGDPV